MPLARRFAFLAALFLASPAIPFAAPRVPRDAAANASTAQAGRLSPAALQVAQVRVQWAQRLNAKQIGPLMNLYAPDAVFLQPTGQRINGALAIRAITEKIWASLTPNISLHGVTTKVSCDMAYDEGDFRETLTSVSGGAKQQTQGQYLMIFKRDMHGHWLIVEQVWTGTEPKGI
ncbi:MAG TPA: DUF4440 domain-containing protein [Candidatus Acidoferrales bacterium]|nr:DUF4440 domain-containing protein [Candidatus Acidoferrales bacterium]